MFHLIATTTVIPSLKSARAYCDRPRTPQFIYSADAQACYEHAMNALGGKSQMSNELSVVLNGLPIFQTSDWTYWIVSDEASVNRALRDFAEDAEKKEGAQ